MNIGVLALQGGFEPHALALSKLGANPIYVKTPSDLESCSGLILPGGESTVMSHLLITSGLLEPLREFAKTKPLFGTCAGLILMSKEGWLDIAVQRNAYGSQSASFITPLTIDLNGPVTLDALFIRAPKIKAILSSKVKILAQFERSPVFVQQGRHLAMTFHPELTQHLECHRFFIVDSVLKGTLDCAKVLGIG